MSSILEVCVHTCFSSFSSSLSLCYGPLCRWTWREFEEHQCVWRTGVTAVCRCAVRRRCSDTSLVAGCSLLAFQPSLVAGRSSHATVTVHGPRRVSARQLRALASCG